MNTIIETKKIFLQPSGAFLYDSLYSNLSYSIPFLFPKDKNIIHNSISVLHAEIPFSWYIINANNNKLVLSTGSYSFAYGNYNANSFMVYLQTLLPSGLVISFDSTKGIFSFIYTTNFSILSTSTLNKITCPFMVNFLGTKNVYINIPNMSLDNYNTTTKTSSTLVCIPVLASPYGIIFHENKTGTKNIIKGYKDDILQIQILDDDFNSLDFNSTEWQITLEIESLKYNLHIENATL